MNEKLENFGSGPDVNDITAAVFGQQPDLHVRMCVCSISLRWRL